MSGNMTSHALAWAARGFRVFPLAVGSKVPAFKGWDWTKNATVDPDLIEKWWSLADYNIGVLTTGLIVVDIDQKNGNDGMSAYMDLDLPLDSLTVRTPTGGRHVYFTGPDCSNSAGRLAAGLDIRGRNGYVVGPGSALSSEGRYAVETDAPVLAAPAKLVGLLATPRSVDAQPADTNRPAVDLDADDATVRAQEHLRHSAPLAVEGNAGDLTTFRVAANLKDMGVSEGVALDLMIEHWNERCEPPWDREELARKVSNAYAYGSLPPGSHSPKAEFKGIVVAEPVVAPPEGKKWFDHGDDWNHDQDWLFYKLLPQSGAALLVGPPGAGKTFVALELARCLATGKPFFQTEPDDRGGTLMLFGGTEGSGLEERMAALGETDPLPIAATRVHALREGTTLADLQAACAEKAEQMLAKHGVPLRLVVIETLSASGLLEDENSNSEAAQAMATLAQVGRNLGVMMLVTHHPPKNGAGERGAGAIRGSADYVMEITREGSSSIRDLELTKGRNAPERVLGSFSLLPVVLGKDKRGRDVSSLTVSSGAPQTKLEKVAGASSEFMEILAAAIYELGENIDGHGAILETEAKTIYRERKSGSRDPSNVNKVWAKQLKFAIETAAVNEFVWAGRKYLRMMTV